MLRFFSKAEKIVIVILLVVVLFTGWYLVRRFVAEHSILSPSEGGIFTEGLVGKPLFLNPTLLLNPVDRDISQLIFSGLTRYNPQTGLIEDDIATSEKSKDNLSYTFKILPDAYWHDSVPVTSDDVLFTYKEVIKNPDFSNSALHQAFEDVTVEKITQKVVRFKLARPYSFFLANVTIGLMPAHLLRKIPVSNLEKIDFNQRPIGTGPYQFVSWSSSSDIHEVTLQRFHDYYGIKPKIQTVIFRVFPDQERLLLNENTLTGFRLPSDVIASEYRERSSRFTLHPYPLPQYSAIFLNTDADILVNKKVRFALLLGTNKQEILSLVPDARLVDTPILESKEGLDIEYSPDRARGALFDADFHLPGKRKAEEEAKKTAEKAKEKLEKPKQPPPSNEPLEFTLEVSADSWVSYIVDTGEKVSRLLQKGSKTVLKVKDKLLFTTIGNAGGLSLSVQGVALKKLGESGEVVRNLLYTRKDIEALLPERPQEVVPQPPAPQTPPRPEVNSGDQEELEKVRINSDGKRLILRLITAQDPPVYLKIAEVIQRQWLEVGAKVIIESYALPDLQEKIRKRDYDLLLFGQNLGYNLDAFQFWHSSQNESGLNLSNYRSLEADNLLVDIRKTFDERTKQALLEKLKKLIADDTPAIFLWSPTQYYVVDKSVKHVELKSLSSHQDRFNSLLSWYVKEDYEMKKGTFRFSEIIRWIISF